MSHQLTPPMIIDNVAQDRFAGTLEAVVLLVDISGFTTLTNRLMHYGTEGAEVLATVLAGIFEPLLQIVYSQGGFVATFGGDAFKAIFPIQQTPAPDTVYARAIVAAAQIRYYLVTHSEQTTRFGAFHFAGKVCLAGGVVEWGVWQGVMAGADQQAAYYVEGAALDACMALDSYGTAGEVLLTQTVYAALPDAATLLQLEPVAEHWRLLPVAEGYLNEWRPLPLAAPAAPGDLATRFFPFDLLAMNTQGEFRRVVTLFLNLQAAPQTLDSAFQHTFFRLLTQYGGYLCRVSLSGSGQSGSTLLLFWGAPVSHENDVERALSFVQALQSASPVPLRAGVTTSLAYAGFVGSTLREEYTCYGTHVNLAVRQMTRAAWGEIWLDAETARQAQAVFAATHHGHFAFKGFAAPQPVFRLGGRQALIAAFYQGELIGRQAELAHLRATIHPIFTGRFAGVILITGESGMGKSRLVHELQRMGVGSRKKGVGSREEGVGSEQHPALLPTSYSRFPPQWFLCQTDEILRQSLNPFRYWLRSYFRQSPTQGEAANKQMFTAKLDELIADLDATRLVEDKQSKIQNLKSEIERTHAFLGALVDLYWPDSLYAQLDPQLRFENTLIALKTLIQAESLCRPVILHLEDGHWLDGDSRTFLLRLTLAVEEFPFAVLITARPPSQEWGEPTALLSPDVPQVTVELDPLATADLTQLAMGRLGGAVASELVTLLSARAEGNPFFAEQVLLYLQEEDALENAETGWRLRAGVDQAHVLPTDARALLVARLDRLTSTVKEVVQTASVLGREFTVQVLSQMLGKQHGLDEKLQDAERAAIWSALSELRYLFKHALLRDAAYEMQLRARLRALHQLAAETMRQLYTNQLAPHAAALAYHYDQAERWEEARQWYAQAGQWAAQHYENASALTYFERALALTPQADVQIRYQLLLACEEIHDLQGNRAAQQTTLALLEACVAMATNLPQIDGEDSSLRWQTEVTLRRAKYAVSINDHPVALQAISATLALAQANGQTLLAAQAHTQWGTILMFQADYRGAVDQFEQAFTLAQRDQDPKVAAEILSGLGWTYIYWSNLGQAQVNFEQAFQIYDKLNDTKGLGVSFHNLGNVALQAGRYAEVKPYYEQSLHIRRRIGDRRGEVSILLNLGMLAGRQGNYLAYRDYAMQSLQGGREIGSGRQQGMALDRIGCSWAYLGDYRQSYTYLEQALTMRRASHDRIGEMETLCNIAWMLQRSGEYQQARTYAMQAIQRGQEMKIRLIEALGLLQLGHAWFGLMVYNEADQIYQQALVVARELNYHYWIVEALAGLAQVALTQGTLTIANNYTDELLTFEENYPGFVGVLEPIRTYLTCYQVRAANHDPRAREILTTAHTVLQAQAAKIEDESLLRSFLENVAVNRAIVEEFARLHSGGFSTVDQP